MLFIFTFFILTLSHVYVANYFGGNDDCSGPSPFILHVNNDTCIPTPCIKNQMGSSQTLCKQPNLGNYAMVKKYKDDVPGDCAVYWSDGFVLINSCNYFGPPEYGGLGHVMVTCEGKNLIQANYTSMYCDKQDRVLTHYLQEQCVYDVLHDNDEFVKFGRCGV